MRVYAVPAVIRLRLVITAITTPLVTLSNIGRLSSRSCCHKVTARDYGDYDTAQTRRRRERFRV
jgi:hypothetical protein